MMRLKNHYFILRHGQTTWPHADICYPPDNKESVALSQEGIIQIGQVAEKLSDKGIKLIFCSEYLRAKLTAQIIAERLNLSVIIDPRLNDTEIGNYYGKPKADFYKEFPDPAKRFGSAPQGGESWNQVRTRQKSFLEEIEKKCQGQNILLVGHGDSLWLFEGLVKKLSNQELLDAIFQKREFIKKGELREIN